MARSTVVRNKLVLGLAVLLAPCWAEAFQLPDTGQTTSFTNIAGEDADYTINPPWYTDNGDGTVTDNNTGLIWQQNEDDVQTYWSDAKAHCAGLSLGGKLGWRLPTKFELVTLVNLNQTNPAIDTAYFKGTNVDKGYWTSAEELGKAYNAWLVDFSTGGTSTWPKGSIYDEGYFRYVRCVHSAP